MAKKRSRSVPGTVLIKFAAAELRKIRSNCGKYGFIGMSENPYN